MKKTSVILILVLSSSFIFAQPGAKWSTGLNSIGNGDAFGTSNAFPILFFTNNTQKMSLGTNGVLNVNNLSGTGNRFLQADALGNLISFPMGSASDVLLGNGTWGNVPGGWKTSGNDLYWLAGNVGIGTLPNSLYKLDVQGDAHFSNNLYVGGGIVITNKVDASVEIKAGDAIVNNDLSVTGKSTFSGSLIATQLAGTGDREVVVDPNGIFRAGNPISPSGACVPGAPQWHLGGDIIFPLVSTSNNDGSIGTCDGVDFVLKANNIKSIWLKTNGKVGIGTSTPSEYFQIGDRFTFHNGGTKYIGYNSYYDVGAGTNKRIVTDYASSIAMSGSQIAFNLATNSGAGSNITFVQAIRMQLDPANLSVAQVWIGDKKPSFGTYTNFRFAVDGIFIAKEVIVTQQNWADYVFSKNYKLMPLLQVDEFIQKNSHLPNIPTAKEIQDNGLKTSEIINKQMEKIEEMTLYLIEMKKEIMQLKNDNNELRNEIKELQKVK